MTLEKFGIDKIYIVHAKIGYEYQENRLKEEFDNKNYSYEFVTDGDVSNFNNLPLQNYFCNDIEKKLIPGILSCTLNHIKCYEKVVANNIRFAIIFENDPFFIGDFKNNISLLAPELNQLPSGFIISLENTSLEFPSIWETQNHKYLYKANRGRCAGAYIIDNKGAEKILKYIQENKCCDVIDWFHNRLFQKKIIDIYWAHPPLTEQGSHNGLLFGGISNRGKRKFRRFKWLMQKYYKYYLRRIWKKIN